jgi:hypothetical protein
MGIMKYSGRMEHGIRFRVTDAQANSLTAMANAMSLTIGDMVRFAIDELVDDIPEPRMFSEHVHQALHRTSPTRRR